MIFSVCDDWNSDWLDLMAGPDQASFAYCQLPAPAECIPCAGLPQNLIFLAVQHGETKLGLGNKHSRIMCVHTESVDRGGVCHITLCFLHFRGFSPKGGGDNW